MFWAMIPLHNKCIFDDICLLACLDSIIGMCWDCINSYQINCGLWSSPWQWKIQGDWSYCSPAMWKWIQGDLLSHQDPLMSLSGNDTQQKLLGSMTMNPWMWEHSKHPETSNTINSIGLVSQESPHLMIGLIPPQHEPCWSNPAYPIQLPIDPDVGLISCMCVYILLVDMVVSCTQKPWYCDDYRDFTPFYSSAL